MISFLNALAYPVSNGDIVYAYYEGRVREVRIVNQKLMFSVNMPFTYIEYDIAGCGRERECICSYARSGKIILFRSEEDYSNGIPLGTQFLDEHILNYIPYERNSDGEIKMCLWRWNGVRPEKVPWENVAYCTSFELLLDGLEPVGSNIDLLCERNFAYASKEECIPDNGIERLR